MAVNSITINGNTLERREGYEYRYDYFKLAEQIKDGSRDEWKSYRTLFATDSWAFMYFVLGTPKLCEKLHHPFLLDVCYELDHVKDDNWLFLLAREHFKTTAITT